MVRCAIRHRRRAPLTNGVFTLSAAEAYLEIDDLIIGSPDELGGTVLRGSIERHDGDQIYTTIPSTVLKDYNMTAGDSVYVAINDVVTNTLIVDNFPDQPTEALPGGEPMLNTNFTNLGIFVNFGRAPALYGANTGDRVTIFLPPTISDSTSSSTGDTNTVTLPTNKFAGF